MIIFIRMNLIYLIMSLRMLKQSIASNIYGNVQVKKYLKNQDIDDMVEMWANLDSLRQETYQECYDEFRDYLMYATDRMGINRWLYLQLLINKTYDLAYDEYCKKHDWRNWTDKIQGGFTDKNLVHGYDLIYQKEWIGTILPLIKQAQRNED